MKISTVAAHWEFNRENRDRRGGHILSTLRGNDFYASSQEGRKFGKRKLNKKRRREHAKITRAALHHYEQELAEDAFELECLIEEFEHDAYMQELAEDPYCYDDYDDYETPGMPDEPDYDFWGNCDPYGYDAGSCDGDYYSAGCLTAEGFTRLDLNARIKHEDAGKSLGEILQEALEAAERN